MAGMGMTMISGFIAEGGGSNRTPSESIGSNLLPKFYAYDADWEAVKATRQNIIAAGFENCDQIQIEETYFSRLG